MAEGSFRPIGEFGSSVRLSRRGARIKRMEPCSEFVCEHIHMRRDATPMPTRHVDDLNVRPEVAQIVSVILGGEVDDRKFGIRRHMFSEQPIVNPGHLLLAALRLCRKLSEIASIDIDGPSWGADQFGHDMAQQGGVAPIHL